MIHFRRYPRTGKGALALDGLRLSGGKPSGLGDPFCCDRVRTKNSFIDFQPLTKLRTKNFRPPAAAFLSPLSLAIFTTHCARAASRQPCFASPLPPRLERCIARDGCPVGSLKIQTRSTLSFGRLQKLWKVRVVLTPSCGRRLALREFRAFALDSASNPNPSEPIRGNPK